MIRQGDEVRQLHGGRLGVVAAIWSCTHGGREGRRVSREFVVRWDDGAESWCGEGDVETTGHTRETRP